MFFQASLRLGIKSLDKITKDIKGVLKDTEKIEKYFKDGILKEKIDQLGFLYKFLVETTISNLYSYSQDCDEKFDIAISKIKKNLKGGLEEEKLKAIKEALFDCCLILKVIKKKKE